MLALGRAGRLLGAEVAVAAAALLARVVAVLASGGYRGNYGYDASVYFAAADGLVHGKVPYRDYLLVHPPVSALVLTPFAWFGDLTSASTGFIAANMFMTLLSALNAVLVLRLCRRFGMGLRAAVVAALFYALWFQTIRGESYVRLELLANVFLLTSLLIFARALERRWGWGFFAGGAALALMTSTKISYAAAVLVVVGWVGAASRSRRLVAWAVGGFLAAAAVVDLPFFLASPRAMTFMVVRAQTERPRTVGLLRRIKDASGLVETVPASGAVLTASAVVIALLAVAGCIVACTVPAGRICVALLGTQVVVLAAGPSWFPFYTDALAVPAALCVGAFAAALGAGRTAGGRLHLRQLGWVPPVLVALQTVVILGPRGYQLVAPFPDGPRLAAAAEPFRCVKSDSPVALIALDALDRSFAAGCGNWVDVRARTFGAGNAADRVVLGQRNPIWQRDLEAYLTSGDAVMLILPQIGLSRSDQVAIREHPVVATNGTYTLYRLR